MDTARSQDLKKLLDAVPGGYLGDAAWLVPEGIVHESFRDYVKRGLRSRITRGVFRSPLPNTPTSNSIDWKTCILSTQHIMGHPHVGGTTALGEQGTRVTCASAHVLLSGVDGQYPEPAGETADGCPKKNPPPILVSLPETGRDRGQNDRPAWIGV
ncbi:AbiEi antitoxin N-terminal domain-containing protein [Plastorhodobacter daqingensis]|uniref:AbiEi antitoxin N-terminal domain-containing protein n=1 Tax=Plastorhodobacter daqingensis TaxID=1387281 RepID=A0ABW2UPP7_9RHOB